MIIPAKSHLKTQSDVNSVPLLDVNRGNQRLKAEVMETLSEIYDSCRFIGGTHCQSLEQQVAEVSGAEFGIGCASGSDALLLALMAIGIEQGDEVICPSFTFFATASAISRLGGVPVFVDIDADTFNMNATLIEEKVTERTVAIIPVHLFGQCCDMDPILEIANRHKIHVIEDCAQSIGATYNGRPCGSMGSVGCFSFYPTKNLGGCGDGGMMTTNDPEIADRLRLLANHGMRPRYYHQEVGINSRLDSMQAAILSIKMKHLSEYSERRQTNAKNYDRLFAAAGMGNLIINPTHDQRCGHVWNQYTIRIPGGQRDAIRQALSEMNVGAEIYYPVPVHAQECYAYLNVSDSELPVTAQAATEVLALPIFPELTLAEQQYVVNCLVSIVTAGSTEMRRAA